MENAITLTNGKKFTETPSPKAVFGSFIESGFGRQVTGMWSEMLYNRAFRAVTPYKYPTWAWLGIEPRMYGPDAPYWHSGYEENDWEDVGHPAKEYSVGTHTYKGKTSLLVTNTVPGEECGLRQREIALKKGRRYVLSVTAGLRGDICLAGINGFGDTIHTDRVLPLTIRLGAICLEAPLTTVVKKHEFVITAPETGRFSLSFTFSTDDTVVFAASSLMPEDNIGGWRREIVETMKGLGLGSVRFPGGCFTSFFDWEASIGPRDRREPQESHYWGGLEENDVGLDEFLFLMDAVAAEPQICFNMQTSCPFKARQLVEYCNAPETVGMGRLRALNGHPAPYGVHLFEMDNEPARKWTWEQYSKECVAYAEEMRLADPGIRFLFAAYPYPLEVLPAMLDIVGETVNYIIYRDGSPDFVAQVLPIVESYNAEHGTKLRLCNTEWIAPCDSPEPFERPEVGQHFSWHSEITNNYYDSIPVHLQSWNYALNGAQRLLEYLSYGGTFAHANFNNMANTWGLNLMEASKEGVWLSCMGRVFTFFAPRFAPCTASLVETGLETLFCLETRDEVGAEKLWLVNHSAKAVTVSLPEGSWQTVSGLVGKSRLGGEKLKEKNVSAFSAPAGNAVSVPGLSVLCVE